MQKHIEESAKALKFTTIDMYRLHEIFNEDQFGILEFIHTFICSTEKLIQEIKKQVLNHASLEAKRAFHTLKGTAGNSGVTKLYEIAKTAEEHVLNGNWEAAESNVQDLEKWFAVLRHEYQENLHNVRNIRR